MTILKNKSRHKSSEYDLYEDVEKIKEALREATLDVKGKASEILSDSVDEMIDQTTNVKDHVVNYTAEQPFKSLGIALLAGIAIGYLIRK